MVPRHKIINKHVPFYQDESENTYFILNAVSDKFPNLTLSFNTSLHRSF